jgi:hypothetical protein|tara:strand:- start:308 stop:463 length:156 start_codon:yes stop_codon:yes gene_type:complete
LQVVVEVAAGATGLVVVTGVQRVLAGVLVVAIVVVTSIEVPGVLTVLVAVQ